MEKLSIYATFFSEEKVLGIGYAADVSDIFGALSMGRDTTPTADEVLSFVKGRVDLEKFEVEVTILLS